MYIFLNGATRGLTAVAEAYGVELYYGAIQVSLADNGAPHAMQNSTAIATTLNSTIFSETADSYGDTSGYLAGGYLMTVLGCFGALVFLALPNLKWIISERALLSVGISSAIVGLGIMTNHNIPVPIFILGLGLLWVVANPLTQTLAVSLMSKTIGRSGRVGLWMGKITAAGSVGRIILPIVSGSLISINGNIADSMIFPLAVAILCEILVVLVLKHYEDWENCACYREIKRKLRNNRV